MKKLEQNIVDSIIQLTKEGLSSRKIAEILNIGSKSTVNRYREQLGLVKPQDVSEQGARILFFDLENAPSKALVFNRWNVNISPDNVIEEGGWLISASWKFKGDTEVSGIVLNPDEAIAQNDERIVATLYELFEQADIVVAHNGKRFDNSLFKTRLIANGFPQHKTVKVVDTLQIAKNLKFSSNKLDSLGHYLGVGRKLKHTGIDLWWRCMNGDKEALDEMLAYNKQDVQLLEDVYERLKSFDQKAPNASHFYNDNLHRCPVCGSAHVTETGHKVFTPVSQFAEVVCNDCGHRSRKRQSLNDKEKKANMLISPQVSG